MIPRIDIHANGETADFGYEVSHESEPMFSDEGLGSVLECLVAAVEGLPPEVRAVEVAFQRIVSGTYGLEVLALNPSPIAQHAVNTTEAVREALEG